MTNLRLLSVAELAERLGKSPDWIYRRIYAKRIPFVQDGKNYVFRETEIDAWFRAQPVREEGTRLESPRTREQERIDLGVPVDHRYS